jgi:aminopeptidase N
MPCIDQPNVKATFKLSVKVNNPNHVAISNTPGEKINDLYVFETTPLMSTYLFCCIIGKFDFCEAISKNGIRVRGYTPVGLSD